MKGPGFIEGAILALVTSLSASLIYSLMSPYLPTESLLRLLIASLALVYIIYLLKRSNAKVGRIVCLLLWLTTSSLCWLMNLPLTLYLIIHIGLIWLIRSLYFYTSLLTSLTDLCLAALGFAAALWAIAQTSSLLIAIWCFFLIQALFSAIPKTLKRPSRSHSSNTLSDFQLAQQRAVNALRNIQSIN